MPATIGCRQLGQGLQVAFQGLLLFRCQRLPERGKLALDVGKSGVNVGGVRKTGAPLAESNRPVGVT